MARPIKSERNWVRLSKTENSYLKKESERVGKTPSEYLRALVIKDMKKQEVGNAKHEADRRALQLAMATHKMLEKIYLANGTIDDQFVDHNMEKSREFAMRYYNV